MVTRQDHNQSPPRQRRRERSAPSPANYLLAAFPRGVVMKRRLFLFVSFLGILGLQLFSGACALRTSHRQASQPPQPTPPAAATTGGQATAGTPSRTGRHGTPPLQPPQAPPAVSGTNSESILSQADQVLEQMSRLTGLPIKQPLKKRIVDRAQIRKLLIDNMHAGYTPQKLHVQQATLRAFGLVSPTFDLEKFLISFYTEQAAGFYDPRTKTMYIADWVPPAEQQMVLSHELTHALQDQNFNLRTYMEAVRSNDDAEAARQAVVEGYATVTMFQKMLGPVDLSLLPSLDTLLAPLIRRQMTEFPVFSNAPFFFRLEALFPYIQGAGFIEAGLKKEGGWKNLNVLFTSPPASTKAIYQPDVYFDHTPLPKLQFPATVPLDSEAGLTKLDENTLGELGINALVGQFLSEDKAKAVSDDWLADRYILYEDRAQQRYALVARTLWTSAEGALTFFRDYHAILAMKYAELSPDPRSTPECFVGRTSSGEVILLRSGAEVRWAEGVPQDKVGAMLEWLKGL